MSAEFYIKFSNKDRYARNRLDIDNKIRSLATFKKMLGDNEYWLKDNPHRGITKGEWEFDVRLFLRPEDIILEISLHPQHIERDISDFVTFLYSIDQIEVADDDGEPAKLTL